MKYIIQGLVLFSLSLNAACTLEEGKSYYKAKEFLKAVSCLENISLQNTNYIEVDMLLAKSAEGMGNVDLAISAYERVLIQDPYYAQAEVDLLSLYQAYGLQEQLNLEISTLLKGSLTTEQRAVLEQLRQDERDKRRQKFLADISMGIGYDSNVNASPGEEKLNNYSVGVGTSRPELSSAFLTAEVDLLYWKQFEENTKWYFQGDVTAFYQNNFSAHDFDLGYVKLSAGLGYSEDNINVYFPLVYDRIHYLQRDLVQSFGLEPSIVLDLSDGYYTALNLSYVKKDYIQSSDNIRNNTVYGIGMSLYRSFDKYYYFTELGYEKSLASETVLSFIDRNKYEVDLGLSYEFNTHYFIDGRYNYAHIKYKDPLFFSEQHRTDRYHKAEVKIRYSLSRFIYLGYGIKYVLNDSNYVPADYDKYINELRFDYRF